METLLKALGFGPSGEVSLGRLTWSGFIAAWTTHFGNIVISPLFVAVTLVWAADYVTGSLLAWHEGRYSTKRGFRSFGKLLRYWALMAGSWVFFLNSFPGDDFIPILVSTLVCLNEFVSILRNSARLSGQGGGWLNRLADNVEGEVNLRFEQIEARRAREREKITLTVETEREKPAAGEGGPQAPR